MFVLAKDRYLYPHPYVEHVLNNYSCCLMEMLYLTVLVTLVGWLRPFA